MTLFIYDTLGCHTSLLHYPLLHVTPCVNNESSLLHYPLLHCNSLCEQ
ncbi:hypothetical protein KSS87_012949 [Heliosperma pusillum]|nr:hypothetical protein KSS87_012949 [Heliosperma pusillum]